MPPIICNWWHANFGHTTGILKKYQWRGWCVSRHHRRLRISISLLMIDPDDDSLEAAMQVPVTVCLGPVGPLWKLLKAPDPLGAADVSRLKDLCIDLKDMSQDEEASFVVRWWMKMVRELCYDTQDHLDVVHDHDCVPVFSEKNGGVRVHLNFPGLTARVKYASERRNCFEWSPKATEPDCGEAGVGRLISHGGSSKSVVMQLPPKLVELLALDDDEKTLKVIPIHGCAGTIQLQL